MKCMFYFALQETTAVFAFNHRVTEYAELEGTHKDHQIQLLALHRTNPLPLKDNCQNFNIWVLKHFLNPDSTEVEANCDCRMIRGDRNKVKSRIQIELLLVFLNRKARAIMAMLSCILFPLSSGWNNFQVPGKKPNDYRNISVGEIVEKYWKTILSKEKCNVVHQKQTVCKL